MTTQTKVYRVVNRPVTIFGVEHKTFFLVLGSGAVLFELTANLLAALVIVTVLLPLARIQAAWEPRLFSILRASRGLRQTYDPFLIDTAKFGPGAWHP